MIQEHEIIRYNLMRIMKKLGYTKNKEFAKAMCISEQYLGQLLNGKKKLDAKSVGKHAKSLEINPDEFFKRPSENKETNIVISVTTEHEKNKLTNGISDYRGIPLYESGKLSAGVNGSAFDQNEDPSSIVVVYRPELKNCSTHRLAALKVGGDSMEPTITEGSIVVVDVDDKEYYDGRVYVINSNEYGLDMASIKRIRKWDKGRGFVIISDNPKYPPDISTLDWPDLCVGRVIWMWRDIRNV